MEIVIFAYPHILDAELNRDSHGPHPRNTAGGDSGSLAISLHKEYRGQGIGTQLLGRTLKMLRAEGYRQVPLSVQKTNYALGMYRNAGFKTVEDRKEELLMVYDLR